MINERPLDGFRLGTITIAASTHSVNLDNNLGYKFHCNALPSFVVKTFQAGQPSSR